MKLYAASLIWAVAYFVVAIGLIFAFSPVPRWVWTLTGAGWVVGWLVLGSILRKRLEKSNATPGPAAE